MEEREALEVVKAGQAPPCLRTGAVICRGCPGWEAMRQAVAPGGPWRGAIIHCPCTGLALRARGQGAGSMKGPRAGP